jgi:flagellar hook-length control protein FliK
VPTPAAAGTDTTKIAAVDGKPADVTTADVKAAGAEAIGKAGADTKAAETTAQAAAMAVPAPRPATAKTTAAAKTSATGEVTASSDEPDAPADTTDAPVVNATAAPVASDTEQAAATKPAVKNTHAETIVKPDGAQTPSAAAAHLHPVSQHDGTPGQTGTQTLGAQATATLQPAVQAPLTPSQPSFTVTAATPSATVPLSGLTMEIAASVRSGKSRFEIRLDPADLGRIDVRIDVDRNGQVTSHLTVEKPETLSMLRQDAPQLQRALNDAGLSTGNGGLQFSLRDQSSQGQNGNQSNPNTHRLILTEDEAVPATVAGSYGRMLSASGGVDIRI